MECQPLTLVLPIVGLDIETISSGNFMKAISTILFLLLTNLTFSQNKITSGVYESSGDTSFWYKNQTAFAIEISLPLLQTSTADEFYRFWLINQVIDIWKYSNGSYNGSITSWAKESVRENEIRTSKIFVKSTLISQDTSKLIRDLYINSRMSDLPTDHSINGWHQGLDGFTYIIENSTTKNYNFKTYWTPEAQESLQAAKQLIEFINTLKTQSNSKSIWDSFAKTIPFNCYFYGDTDIICKILTKGLRKNL